MPVMPRDGPITRTRAAALRNEETADPEPNAPAVGSSSGREPHDVDENAPLAAINVSAPGTSGGAALTMDAGALFAQLRALQEDQARKQEEHARRQADQLRTLQEEQARRQADQLRVLQEQEERQQARQEQLLVAISENANRLEELNTVIDIHDHLLSEYKARVAVLEQDFKHLKETRVAGTPAITTLPGYKFKLPPFDGTTSWAAFKKQLQSVIQLNGWGKDEAKTALTLALREKATTVLEVVEHEISYDGLLDALESRYGDSHLEHVYRAQLRNRSQKSNETLQQWSLEVEKLVRKAYQSSPAAFTDSMLLQAFVDGIADQEVRATVRLAHHTTVKEAIAHALEVEAVRRDSSSGRLRKLETADSVNGRRPFIPRCYRCGERGHMRANCPCRATTYADNDAGTQTSANPLN